MAFFNAKKKYSVQSGKQFDAELCCDTIAEMLHIVRYGGRV